jgi:Lysozyme like domain
VTVPRPALARTSAPTSTSSRAVVAAQAAMGVGLTGDALVMAVAIAGAETGGTWSPTAHNPIPPDNSYGLWQINMLGNLGPARRAQFHLTSNDELYDPDTNARAMYAISHGGTNWGAWSTYLSGAYNGHLTTARAAVQAAGGTVTGHTTTVPGPVHQVFPHITDAQWRSFSTAKQLQLRQQAAQQIAAQAGVANDKAHNSGVYGAVTGAGNVIASGALGVGQFLALLANPATWRRVLFVVVGLAGLVIGAFLLDRSLLNQVAGTAVTNAAGAIARVAV